MQHLTSIATTLAVGVITITATAGPAEAAQRSRLDLRGAGVGSYVLGDTGAARLSGEVTGRPFGGAYSATLAAADGSLPEPGTCEPAASTLEVTGPRDQHLRLEAAGEVCGLWADTTYVVTHRFVGSYVVTASSERRLRGTDGWMSTILATEGRANVEAIDT